MPRTSVNLPQSAGKITINPRTTRADKIQTARSYVVKRGKILYKENPKLQMDIKMNGTVYTMKFELFMNKYPKFIKNFIAYIEG